MFMPVDPSAAIYTTDWWSVTHNFNSPGGSVGARGTSKVNAEKPISQRRPSEAHQTITAAQDLSRGSPSRIQRIVCPHLLESNPQQGATCSHHEPAPRPAGRARPSLRAGRLRIASPRECFARENQTLVRRLDFAV